MAKITINPKAIAVLKKNIEEAFAEVVSEYGMECEDVIADENEFSDIGLSDRDIVDTGRLRDSQLVNVERSDGEVKATYSWDPVDPQTGEHYAGDVFVGWGRIPGRDWPGRAAQRRDWQKIFEAEVRMRL